MIGYEGELSCFMAFPAELKDNVYRSGIDFQKRSCALNAASYPVRATNLPRKASAAETTPPTIRSATTIPSAIFQGTPHQ